MTPTREHATLMRRLYEIGTMRFGDFTLKSGIKSPFYIDLRVVICYPDVLRRIGVLMNNAEDDPESKAQLVGFRQGLQQLGWPVMQDPSLSCSLI